MSQNTEPSRENLLVVIADLVEASKLGLQLIKDNWPHEHGQAQVGLAWGALEYSITKAERMGTPLPSSTDMFRVINTVNWKI